MFTMPHVVADWEKPQTENAVQDSRQTDCMTSAPQWLKDEIAKLDSGSKWLGKVTGA